MRVFLFFIYKGFGAGVGFKVQRFLIWVQGLAVVSAVQVLRLRGLVIGRDLLKLLSESSRMSSWFRRFGALICAKRTCQS